MYCENRSLLLVALLFKDILNNILYEDYKHNQERFFQENI